MPSVADVVARASDAAFGRRLVTNVLRGHVVEAIVAAALEPEWRWCAADYASWDFERAVDGLRLEVKQSARRQTWDASLGGRHRPSFDVRARAGRWEGPTWISEPGRAAHLYLFCWHDRADNEADHRDPMQWTFYIVPTATLPPVGRLALGTVRKLAEPCGFEQLRDWLTGVAGQVRLAGQSPSVSMPSPATVTDESRSPNGTSRRSW